MVLSDLLRSFAPVTFDREVIREAARDPDAVQRRLMLADFSADTFQSAGQALHVMGHIVGPDRREGQSPFGHGNDATVAVSMLLRVAAQLVSGSVDLIRSERVYAGSALIRQIVEIEYLAWAFEAGNAEAAAWLRSDKKQRRDFFSPVKLRAAAGGRFRSVDYGYHCELGGHPTPGSWSLLNGDKAVAQLMLSDCLGHAGSIWDHVVGWAKVRPEGEIVLPHNGEMLRRYAEWKAVDPLTNLPPPSA